jgi:hypothetical protein
MPDRIAEIRARLDGVSHHMGNVGRWGTESMKRLERDARVIEFMRTVMLGREHDNAGKRDA